MGLISRLISGGGAEAIGRAATGVAEVFTPNATRQMENAHAAYIAALGQLGAEFGWAGDGAFDRFVNGMNRLPRPLLAFGTIALFVHAMIDPEGFSRRMVGLSLVPEPLWWLLAAIVGFYFGAREAHYLRLRGAVAAGRPSGAKAAQKTGNPALEEWRRRGG
ncbi:holin (3TMs family) [Albidovulum inexpectatum]|uniref:Holin (3TMs family) n=1 Tax=Albidovulum inexpectatum TaxID=196587 RepID=A0A2S5JJR5_9RHOB|nr:holin family protein [Albidovulum inexpectatum]PPB81700.1 holin (3TMs family) [Albidovulum inexpectatum]